MAMSKWIGRPAIALLVALAASSAFAQNAGSLRGTITDQQGAVLPGAAVVLTNEATKATRQVVTDAKGGYFFAALLPGNYTISVELSGFKGKTTRGIRISPNDTRGYDVTMEIGGQSEKIEVTALPTRAPWRASATSRGPTPPRATPSTAYAGTTS